MSFINNEFLLTTAASRKLYQEYAVDQPIIDYHNHLSPKDIAENRQFKNPHDMWIDHDHYKWRAMRAAGVDEQLITCLLYTSPSPRDQRGSRMPSSA